MPVEDMEHMNIAGEGASDSKPPRPAAGQSPWRWVLIAAVAALTVVAAVLLVLYLQAIGDRDDTRQSLSETEAELSASEAALDASEAELSASEAALDASEAELEESTNQLVEAERATSDFLATTLALSLGIDEPTATCMAASLYDEHGLTILQDFAAAAAPNADASAVNHLVPAMVQAAESCGATFEGLADMAVAPASSDAADQPSAAGSAVDALYAECAAGSGTACDALIMMAEPFSEEETFALTCGDRFDIDDAPLTCAGNM